MGGGRHSAVRVRRATRNTVFLLASDTVTKIGLLVLTAVIARTLGDRGYGEYTLAISLAFFVRAGGLGLDVILSREVARDLDRLHALFWKTVLLKSLFGLSILAVVTSTAVASGYSSEVVAAIALIGLSNAIDIVAFSCHAALRGREDMAPGSKALALESLVILVVAVPALIVFDGNLIALSAAYMVAALVGLHYIWRAMWRRGMRPRLSGDRRGLRWLTAVALPMGVASFFSYALGRIDAVMLFAITEDSAAVGLYGSASRLFEATLAVSWALGLAVFPALSEATRRTDALGRLFGVACMASAAVTVPCGTAMTLFGPTIVELVFGPEFRGAGTAARILGGAIAFSGVFTIAALTLASQDRQWSLPWLSGLALLVNVSLNLLLIPSLGLDGAAIAMTVAQGLLTATTVALALRETGWVSPARMFAAACVGAGGMAVTAGLMGTGLFALAMAALVYCALFLAAEWLAHRDDLRVFIAALRNRGAGPEPATALASAEAPDTIR